MSTEQKTGTTVELPPLELEPAAKALPSILEPHPLALSPMQQLAQAKELGLTVAELKEILELEKEYEAKEARKAFHAAMAEFKKNPPQVVKDKLNEKYGSDYVSIGNMVNTVNEAMGPYGLNARWSYPEGEDGIIYVTCILAHALGHEEQVTLNGPPDTEGSKNPIQQRKSTRTYLKLETFEAVTGMASVSGNVDDDGNTTGRPRAPEVVVISEEESNLIDAKIRENGINSQLFTNWLAKKCPYTKGNPNKISVDHLSVVMAKLDETIAKKAEKNV